ncbi:GNAT family protein [Bacillaceae bacterium S4-13-58]
MMISKMTEPYAKDIFNWKYKAPYDLYNSTESEENLKELLDGSYYAVFNSEKSLIGFFCFGPNAQVPVGRTLGLYKDSSYLDIGLGMLPDLSGRGLGLPFLLRGLAFAEKEFQAVKFRLTVATFNQRAISLYKKCFFKEGPTFPTDKYDFMIMFNEHFFKKN